MYRLALSLIVLLAACGDDATLPILDAGSPDVAQDDAAIRFDATATDAGTLDVGPADTGPADTGASDAGPDVSIDAGPCRFTLEDGLSDGCFPACEEGSRDALAACFDYDCTLEVLQMGDGSGLTFDGGPNTLFFTRYLTDIVEATESCHQCETLVTRACEHDVCPDEATAFFSCLGGADGMVSCFPRSMAVFECATSPANDVAYNTCYREGLDRCAR